MQNFRTLGQPLLGENLHWEKERSNEKEKEKKNYVLPKGCTWTLLGPIHLFSPRNKQSRDVGGQHATIQYFQSESTGFPVLGASLGRTSLCGLC